MILDLVTFQVDPNHFVSNAPNGLKQRATRCVGHHSPACTKDGLSAVPPFAFMLAYDLSTVQYGFIAFTKQSGTKPRQSPVVQHLG